MVTPRARPCAGRATYIQVAGVQNGLPPQLATAVYHCMAPGEGAIRGSHRMSWEPKTGVRRSGRKVITLVTRARPASSIVRSALTLMSRLSYYIIQASCTGVRDYRRHRNISIGLGQSDARRLGATISYLGAGVFASPFLFISQGRWKALCFTSG